MLSFSSLEADEKSGTHPEPSPKEAAVFGLQQRLRSLPPPEPTDRRSPGNLLISAGPSVALMTEMVGRVKMKARPFASSFQPRPNTSAAAVLGIKVA